MLLICSFNFSTRSSVFFFIGSRTCVSIQSANLLTFDLTLLVIFVDIILLPTSQAKRVVGKVSQILHQNRHYTTTGFYISLSAINSFQVYKFRCFAKGVVGAVGKISPFQSQGNQFDPQLCQDLN